MRDEAFTWLDAQAALGAQTFTLNPLPANDCDPATGDPPQIWKVIEGTFQVPLYLEAAPGEGSSDPITNAPGLSFLKVDANQNPVQNGFYGAPYAVAIPCSVLAGRPVSPMLFGHGLFGNGPGSIKGLIADALVGELVAFELIESFDYIAGATNFSGLSGPDFTPTDPCPPPLIPPVCTFIGGTVVFDVNNIAALPDRLRQGQLATLVLARMMRNGMFNVHSEFQIPDSSGVGVFPGPGKPVEYFGASLGGIMGLMFAALTPDAVRLNVDVPGINFSFLIQRATPFLQFEQLLAFTGVFDPMEIAIALSILHELWVRGEPAGYATHITRDPFDRGHEKQIPMTMAFLDQQVSNQVTEIAARTLGLPMLEGSHVSGLAEIPDLPGPLDSAMVVYDTASFDLDNLAHFFLIPPLVNLQPQPHSCDPHGRRSFIPASLEQLMNFLREGGQIVNFCDGRCDADFGAVRVLSTGDDLRIEIPFNDTAPCLP